MRHQRKNRRLRRQRRRLLCQNQRSKHEPEPTPHLVPKLMSTQGSASNLVQAARILNIEWEKTKTYWRDVKSQEFEYKYLEELPGQIASATAAMEELELLLKKVRGDCE